MHFVWQLSLAWQGVSEIGQMPAIFTHCGIGEASHGGAE